jgi:hypothetical protein
MQAAGVQCKSVSDSFLGTGEAQGLLLHLVA